MKARFVLVLLCVSMLTGCYLNGRLYPVQGPAATQTPPPIYAARISGGWRSGTFRATLQNGERCTGAWSQVSIKPTQQTSTPAVSQADLSKVWDTVYGPGFYTAHVLGAPIHIHGVLNGDKGTVLHVDAYRNLGGNEEDLDSRKGVAFDTTGNIYKLVF